MKSSRSLLLYLASTTLLTTAHAQTDWPQLQLTQVGAGFTEPVHITSARDGSDRLFVVEQPGRIKIIQSNSVLPQPFLDITNRISSPPGGVYGLLSVAFPSNYAAKNCFYVYYSRTNDQATVISRFFVSTNANQADAWSEQVLLVIPLGICEPGVLGGQVAFGPDGYLYISTGDEGMCGDDPTRAQLPDSLWGKILRIDVESTNSGYVVPTNNPFVGQAPYLPEIWAMGLRNPWRFSFDRGTGDLYIADVGLSSWEEIDFQPASSPGGQNYGWNVMEGNQPTGLGTTSWNTNDLTPPAMVYPHTNGPNSSVTGGFVYRGPNAPRMNGLYFFGDFIAGIVWGAVRSNGTWTVQQIPLPGHYISSFGEDESGRLYLVDYIFGKAYRIEDSGLAGPPVFNPGSGVSTTDAIIITSSSPGAAIHYTTNGAVPTESDPLVPANDVVFITSGTTLSARAFRADLQPSTVTVASFTLQVATPVFSPRHGPITDGTMLSMSTVTPGASIYYTLDGTDPTPASLPYTAPFSINITNVVSARGYRTGFADSAINRVYFSGTVMLTNVIRFASGFLNFNWASETGRTYQVQISSNLLDWSDLGLPQTGTDKTIGASVQMLGTSRFLRVRIY